jgi:hypothetical protein
VQQREGCLGDVLYVHRRETRLLQRQVEDTFGGDRGCFPEVRLHELARAQARPRQPRLHEVLLDLGVHPIEAEGGVECRAEPGELHDVPHARRFGRVDERALRVRELAVRPGDHQHALDTVQRSAERLRTAHVAFDDLDARRCVRPSSRPLRRFSPAPSPARRDG